jgi:type VI secretion system protein ImpG
MAESTWQSSSPLMQDLLARGHEFSFNQIMRLARIALGADAAPNFPKASGREQLRIRPELSLAFPAADVANVQRCGQNEAELLVTATFLGLYGVSSPLPTHYTEYLLEEGAADSSVSRDFLDIIHQRLYQLYFQAWSKYRLFVGVAEANNHLDRERLFCLIGLGEEELRSSLPDAWSLVRYAGLLTGFPRSAQGLLTLLRDALGMRAVEIEQCVLRKVPVPADQQMCLGLSSTRLGVDTFLRSEMPDRTGKLRIALGPLSREDFDSFLPGALRHEKLASLVRLYVNDPLELDVKLTLAAGQARPIRLGDPDGPRLGLNTWSFSGTLGEVSAIFPMATVAASVPDTGLRCLHDSADKSASLTGIYLQELSRLRDLASDYAESHPEVKSMVMGQVADPGIERLFEGVAFLTANLQSMLADDFPELIHPLTKALHPWHMRPVPSTTIAVFTPKPGLLQPLRIAAGTELASHPVQGTTCRFRTCFDVTMHPLTLLNASFKEPSGKSPTVELSYQLNGVNLSGWKVDSIRFFLGGDTQHACDLYLLLMRYLKRIVLTAEDGGACVEVPADCLKRGGFGARETMLATDCSISPGHLLLQEYFLFPDKFLFVDLNGMQRCNDLGNGSRFRITFEFKHAPFPVPPVKEDSFIVSAVPLINLFHDKAKPLVFSKDTGRLLVEPTREKAEHCNVYSVDRISEFGLGRAEGKTYFCHTPLSRGSSDDRRCCITHSASPLTGGFDTWLSLEDNRMDGEVYKRKLKVDLTCTNGVLPEELGVGAINCATSTSPEAANYRNIKRVTAAILPDTETNRQWRMLSVLSLNTLSLDGPESFRAILRLFIPSNSRDQVQVEAYKKKIDGLSDIELLATDWVMHGRMYRGYEVRLKACGENYSGPGDLFIFCSALERFLRGYVTVYSFIRLIVEETSKGYVLEWPRRMGDRELM